MSDGDVPRKTAKALVRALCNYGGCKGEQAAGRIAPEILAECRADDIKHSIAWHRAEAERLEREAPACAAGSERGE